MRIVNGKGVARIPGHSSLAPRNGEDRETTSFDGVRIAWTLYRGGTGPAILIVPGFWRTRSHHSIVAYATTLVEAGYTVAAVDLRGHGDSGGTFGFNLNEYLDVEAVAKELLDQIECESLVLVGFSYGGAVSVSTAAMSHLPIGGLFLISPVAEFQSIRPRINPLTMHRHVAPGQAFHRPSFVTRVWSIPKRSALEDIHQVDRPVHFLHVRNDWLVDHHHSERLAEAHPGRHELEILDIPGNHHADRIFRAAPGRVEESSLRFFRGL